MAPTKKKEVESEREVWFWSLSPTFWHDGCPCDQLFFSSAKVPRDLCVLLSKMVVHLKLNVASNERTRQRQFKAFGDK